MKEIHNNCSLCSLACPFILRGGDRSPIFTGESVFALDWDSREESTYGGSLCARGNAMVEFVSHPKRLNYPFVLGDRATFDAAVKDTAKNLAAIKDAHGADSIGILVGDNLTNEEAWTALGFARDVLGTTNIELFAPDDIPLFRAWTSCDLSSLGAAGSTPGGDREVALVIGDLFTEHPCTAKHVLPVKRASRDSEVIVVGHAESHTAWFADRHLRCKPGGEAAVLAGMLKAAVEGDGAKLTPELEKFVGGTGWNELERYSGISKEDLEAAAGVLLCAAKVRTYLSNIFGRIGALDLASLFAEAMTRICPGESAFLPKFVQHNTWGIYSVLAAAGGGKLLEKLESAELKALIILGLDLFSAYPAAPVEKALRGKKFTVTTQVFWNQTASRANVVIPAAVPVEKQGTVSISFDEDLVRDEIVPPPGGAVTDADFLVAVAREMGAELATGGSPDRKTERSGSCEWLSASWASYATEMGAIDAAETVLIPWSEPVHVGDGSLSRNFPWSEQTCPEPVLHISSSRAAAMKLKNGDTVTVTSDGGEVSLPVRITGRLTDGVVGATVHFPAVRKLFPWRLDEPSGEIRLAPIQVSMSRTSEKS